MKKFFKSVAVLLAISAVSLGFIACSDDDDDDDDSTPSVTLPKSVGENPVTGKTFTIITTASVSVKFTDSTAEFTDTSGRKTITEKYSYTYDADKSLLYLAFKSYSDKDGSYSSVSEAVSLAIAEEEITGAELEQFTAETIAEFTTISTYKYTISGDSIVLDDYFTGTLPSDVEFSTSVSSLDIWLQHGELGFRKDGPDYSCFPNFKSDGTFSGSLFKDDDEEVTKLGTIAGTYKTSGTGTSGCSVKLTFATLPSGFSEVTTGTEYTLTQLTLELTLAQE